ADVVAVGDGENDLPLLEAAGIGVAMGNAAPEVRARADAVVRGHDADGVAEAIERFVLNRQAAD
ncbi:MAG TPA: HAD hydrolase family protein, partial [Thermomicrobiaceae bacterium]|nr:HAD hydrolase family protein [Thermomicrobiaceae bacterium]